LGHLAFSSLNHASNPLSPTERGPGCAENEECTLLIEKHYR
jgi:hypothetical protein